MDKAVGDKYSPSYYDVFLRNWSKLVNIPINNNSSRQGHSLTAEYSTCKSGICVDFCVFSRAVPTGRDYKSLYSFIAGDKHSRKKAFKLALADYIFRTNEENTSKLTSLSTDERQWLCRCAIEVNDRLKSKANNSPPQKRDREG